jgi:uncharacterized OsmC-like protein
MFNSLPLIYVIMRDSIKNSKFNGINTQILSTVFDSIKNQPKMAKATFSVKTQWNGNGFSVTSSCKDFRIGDQVVQRNKGYTMVYDFAEQFSGEGNGPTVCESCMASLGTCIAQTIVAHATSMGIELDSINIQTEGDVDLRGFSGISSNIRPGAQEFRVNINIDSNTATKEQINQLYEIGKKLSPAFDTLTNGTSVILVNSSSA